MNVILKNTYKWIGAALLVALCATVFTQSPVPAPAPTTVAANEKTNRFARGILWRIESVKKSPSYLLGTIHSDDARVTALPKPVEEQVERAKSITLEMIFDAAALMTLTEQMSYRDGRTLRSTIGDALYIETRVALRERGLPPDGFENAKPWAVLVSLTAPRGLALDYILQARAVAAGKPVHGLESAKEQVEVFDELPLPDQIQLLKETLRDRTKIPVQIEELTRAYLARDLATITTSIEKYRPADSRVYDLLMERLLSRRNHVMVERMLPRLEEGNALIAVGAAHLAGKDGVLPLLERKGYRVSPVY